MDHGSSEDDGRIQPNPVKPSLRIINGPHRTREESLDRGVSIRHMGDGMADQELDIASTIADFDLEDSAHAEIPLRSPQVRHVRPLNVSLNLHRAEATPTLTDETLTSGPSRSVRTISFAGEHNGNLGERATESALAPLFPWRFGFYWHLGALYGGRTSGPVHQATFSGFLLHRQTSADDSSSDRASKGSSGTQLSETATPGLEVIERMNNVFEGDFEVSNTGKDENRVLERAFEISEIREDEKDLFERSIEISEIEEDEKDVFEEVFEISEKEEEELMWLLDDHYWNHWRVYRPHSSAAGYRATSTSHVSAKDRYSPYMKAGKRNSSESGRAGYRKFTGGSENNGDDSGDDGDKGPKSRSAQIKTKEYRFACPFLKWRPHEFSKCTKNSGFSQLSYLKMHLRKSHHRPSYCNDCSDKINKDEKPRFYERHDTGQCKKGLNEDEPFMSNEKLKIINERAARSKKREENWKDIYKALFPEQPYSPSPYFGDNSVMSHESTREYSHTAGCSFLANEYRLEGKYCPQSLQAQNIFFQATLERWTTGALERKGFIEQLGQAPYNPEASIPDSSTAGCLASSSLTETAFVEEMKTENPMQSRILPVTEALPFPGWNPHFYVNPSFAAVPGNADAPLYVGAGLQCRLDEAALCSLPTQQVATQPSHVGESPFYSGSFTPLSGNLPGFNFDNSWMDGGHDAHLRDLDFLADEEAGV